MPNTSTAQFQRVAKELYKKNLELVNANKEMALLQKLYEIMADKFTVEEVAEGFIQIISKDLNLRGGIIFLRTPTTHYLHPLSWYFTRNNLSILKLIGTALRKSRLSLYQKTNPLVKSFHDRNRTSSNKLDKVFSSIISPAKAKTITQLGQIDSTLIYPLTFGHHALGVAAFLLPQSARSLSDFEKEVLKRVSIIFGVAIDRVTIYQDLRAANKKLQILDHLKDEFVSIASHELRTPMTAIKSYLWMILNNKQKEDQITTKTSDYLRRAYISTERLIALVNDMLDVSRIEGGRVELKPESFNIQELSNEVKEEVAARATENQLQVIVNSADSPLLVWADKNKIHQVLLNLVGNALKFTPPGGTITIGFKTTNSHLETSVSDTGKGVSPEDLPKLFTKFGRLEGDLASIASNKGTGLGLYICKQYVELSGGQITVQSELNHGSTFTFTLPVSKDQTASST